jgi:DNA helicase-2/ATP-dependent DNA helicase PcrA
MTHLDIFLANAALMADVESVEEGQEKVTLMSLHSAKGLEFPIVFLVGLEEGIFPHNRALTDETQMEEERRLCYVGMTRARRRLYLTSASTRSLWGQTQWYAPSRFLDEVPDALLELRNARRPAWATGRSAQPTDPGRSRWGESRSFDDDATPAIGASGWGRSAEAKELQRRGAAPPKWDTPAAASPNFVAGDPVWHAKFGEGVVREARGETVTVHFPGVGQKTLLSSYLKPIEPDL